MASFFKSIKSLGNLTFGSNKYEGKNNYDSAMGAFYDLKQVKDIDGKDRDFKEFYGKVTIITNVACKCGFTQGSYTEMEKLMIKYESKGLKMLCFPCNQFMGQEPWTEKEIKQWVIGKWPKLNPTMFSKISVNGDNVDKTYKYLKTCFPGDINWNFATKFVVGKDGIPVQRFDKNQTWQEIEKCIQTELEKNYESKDDDNKGDDTQMPKDYAPSLSTGVYGGYQLNKDKDDETKDEEPKDNVNDDKVSEQTKATFDAKDYVEKSIKEGPIVMISKSYCPYCKKAKEILSKYDTNIIKKEIDKDFNDKDMKAIQDYCKEKTGGSSVPRVFIDGKFIGGCDDTEALDKDNKLKPLIEAAISK